MCSAALVNITTVRSGGGTALGTSASVDHIVDVSSARNEKVRICLWQLVNS
jgi:hypothetical protein